MRVLAHRSSRRAFLVLWGGWTVVALLAAALYELFHESGLVAAALMVIAACSVAAVLERRFRLKNLPPEARRPWHAILVLPLLFVSILVVVSGKSFGHYLPGSEGQKANYQLIIMGQDATEEYLELLFAYEWRKANWGPSTRRKRFSETRIWMKDHEENTWVLDSHLREARSKDGPAQPVILAPAGYEELVRRLAKAEIAPGQVNRSADALREMLSKLRTGSPIIASGESNYQYSGRVGSLRREALFFWLAAVLFSLMLIPVTLVVVGATMYPEVGDE